MNNKKEELTKNTKIIKSNNFKIIKNNRYKNIGNNLGFLIITVIMSAITMLSVYVGGGFNVIKDVDASINMTRVVQAKLYDLGYYDNEINGKMNKSTIDAILSFQKDNGLIETGKLNDATIEVLGVSANERTNSELYLLAKLIYSEARGEVYTGQVAVGAVVLNRVDNAGFPNTLQGVIYQPWAFTALHDGQFNLEPNSTAYQAAQDAMNGWDPSYGSLYYYNPKTASSSWIFSRTTIVVIGNHVFAI